MVFALLSSPIFTILSFPLKLSVQILPAQPPQLTMPQSQFQLNVREGKSPWTSSPAGQVAIYLWVMVQSWPPEFFQGDAEQTPPIKAGFNVYVPESKSFGRGASWGSLPPVISLSCMQPSSFLKTLILTFENVGASTKRATQDSEEVSNSYVQRKSILHF